MPTVDESLINQLIHGSEEEKIASIRSLAEVYDSVTEARDYELLATRIATVPVNGIIRLTSRIAEDKNEPNTVRVFAAVTCATACRRSRIQSEGRHVVRSVQTLEHAYPILRHMRALSYLDGPPSEVREGLGLAESAYGSMPHNPGVAHSLACFLVDVSYMDGSDTEDIPRLQRALGLVNDALARETRPRFFYTRARIHRKLGNFREAKADLATAIDHEDRESSDHRERITSYLIESSMVDADRSTSELIRRSQESIAVARNQILEMETKMGDSLARIREAQVRMVETIAFFASALALIQFTAVTLGKGYNLVEAVTLVGALGLVLFVAVISGAILLRRGIK